MRLDELIVTEINHLRSDLEAIERALATPRPLPLLSTLHVRLADVNADLAESFPRLIAEGRASTRGGSR
jgi:hypothetical protein